MAKLALNIEEIEDDDGNGIKIMRAQIPEGWLVYLVDSSTSVPSSPVKVLDPKHDWEPTETNDA